MPAKRITLDVEPSVHLTGPDTLEINSPFAPHEVRLPISIWDILGTPPGFLDDAGFKAVTVQDDTASSHTAQYGDEHRLVMTTPAKRLTLELADSVRVLGAGVLEVDWLGHRTEATIEEILAYHLSGFDAFNEEGGVHVVSVEDDLPS